MAKALTHRFVPTFVAMLVVMYFVTTPSILLTTDYTHPHHAYMRHETFLRILNGGHARTNPINATDSEQSGGGTCNRSLTPICQGGTHISCTPSLPVTNNQRSFENAAQVVIV
jgi:hypothetical protein